MRVLLGMTLCALIVSACSGETRVGPMAVAEYVTALDQVIFRFDESVAQAREQDYPIESELVTAAEVFRSYGEALEALQAIRPPAALAGSHRDLVAAFGTMQTEVSDYLQAAGMEGGFTIAHLNEDPRVAQAVDAFFEACGALSSELARAGVDHLPPICRHLGG